MIDSSRRDVQIVATAFHEAGHVVASLDVGCNVRGCPFRSTALGIDTRYEINQKYLNRSMRGQLQGLLYRPGKYPVRYEGISGWASS